MRVVVQRVKSASCVVDGQVVGSIGVGLLCFVGIGKNDSEADVKKCVDKIGGIRIFKDDDGKMSRSCDSVGGEFLLISNFTLFGNIRHGKRPDFTAAADATLGRELFDMFVDEMRRQHAVSTGVFGADMTVNAVNDGPITIIFDTESL